MYPTRGTRIHSKGLQSPLEGGPPHREIGANKGSICRYNMLDFLLKASPLRARERGPFNHVRVHKTARAGASLNISAGRAVYKNTENPDNGGGEGFTGRAAIGFDHDYNGELFYLGLALDERYLEGWVEGCLERIGEDEERLFRNLWDEENQREVVIESLRADCEVRTGRPPSP
jgi:hypothetical protein